MSRKVIPVASALGALAALWGTTAGALAPNVAIQNVLFVGGATAQDPSFELIARTVCQNVAIDPANPAATANSRMDIYRGTDNQAFTCLSNGEVATNGQTLAIFKTSVGGSGTGTLPVARQQTALYFPADLTTLASGGNCTVAAAPNNVVGSVTVGARTAAQYLNHTACGPGTRQVIPQIGISDVEPALIDGALTSDVNALTTVAVNHGVFGFAVSEPLRNALQAAQNLVACSVARGDASRELLANQPSLTRDQIRAIITGNLTNWNQLTVRNPPSAAGQGLYAYISANGGAGCLLPPAVGGGEGGARTFIIRRVPSSGTQAITEIWALNQRCSSGVAGFLDDSDPANDSSTTTPTFSTDNYVQAYSSSSGVRHGLDRSSGPWSAQASPLATAQWAIGNLSCENTWRSTGSGDRSYRFVKIGGAVPGLKDTVNSAYDFYAEQVVNTNTATPPPAGAPATFATYLTANLSDTNVLRLVNAGFQQPGATLPNPPGGTVPGDWVSVQGQGCLLGVPDGATLFPPAQPITATSITNSPINSSWKRPLGFTNNCQDPVVLGVAGNETPVGGYNEPNPQ